MQSGGAPSRPFFLKCLGCPVISAPQLPSARSCVLALCIFVLLVSAISPVDDAVQQDYGSLSHARVIAVKAGCGGALRPPPLTAIPTTGGTPPALMRREGS